MIIYLIVYNNGQKITHNCKVNVLRKCAKILSYSNLNSKHPLIFIEEFVLHISINMIMNHFLYINIKINLKSLNYTKSFISYITYN